MHVNPQLPFGRATTPRTEVAATSSGFRFCHPIAAATTAMGAACPVSCHRCAETWTVDPAFTVACRRCGADASEPCWEAGRIRTTPHLGRDYAAMRAGTMSPCGGLTWDGRHARTPAIDLDQRNQEGPDPEDGGWGGVSKTGPDAPVAVPPAGGVV